jgi:hypothetical protein
MAQARRHSAGKWTEDEDKALKEAAVAVPGIGEAIATPGYGRSKIVS